MSGAIACILAGIGAGADCWFDHDVSDRPGARVNVRLPGEAAREVPATDLASP
jgi:hypothetical protein